MDQTNEIINLLLSIEPRRLDELLSGLPAKQLNSVMAMMEMKGRFKGVYRNDPAAFMADCFKWDSNNKRNNGPTKYQLMIADELVSKKRLAVRAPHGTGKTALAAMLTIWFALTRDGEDWKNPSTASNWRQLSKYLWPEVHKWVRRLNWAKIQSAPWVEKKHLLDMSIKLRTGEAFGVASNKPDLIEGAHADSLFYMFDEAKAIPNVTWDAAEGAFSGAVDNNEAFALAISTPGEPNGRFYDICSRKPGYEDWASYHITISQAIEAKRVSSWWVKQREMQWGHDSAIYQNRVLGEFAVSQEENVIPLAWVEMAVERWYELKASDKLPDNIECIGADIARYGSDKTTFAFKHENIITEVVSYSKKDTMQTTGRLAAKARKYPGVKIIVDVIGVGAGVYDRLREQGLNVIDFNAGESTNETDRSGERGFFNKRSAAWWNLRELLDPSNDESIALPPDELLMGDLVTPKWKYTSGGKIKVESKDDIRKRLGRSTDKADAVIQAFYGSGISSYGISI